MDVIDVNYIGYFGAFLIGVNLIPQIFHIYKIKNTESISTLSLLLNVSASIIMCIYGILIERIPVIISNGLVLVFSLILVGFKFRYG